MCSNNIWAGTKVKATTKNYSAEAIDVQPTGKIDFSNSGDVVVHASSEFGATAVVAYGAVTFNNSGNVLLKSEITGNQTAQRNVVGVMSQDSSFTVTDKVQELRIDLKGAGVDFNPANRERQKFCVHGIIGARQTGASNEHEHQTQFS